MNRNVTDIIKFVCCVLIFLHHFFLGNPVTTPLGTIACTIFFFLSSYGISKSLESHPVTITEFCKRRLVKIYQPLLFVNLFFICLTSFCLNETFKIPVFGILKDIQWVEYSFSNFIAYVIGFKKTDSVTWFIDYLLLSYLVIWGIMQFASRKSRLIASIAVVIINIVSFTKITPPPPIWEIYDSIGLYIGFIYAQFEERINGVLKRHRSIYLIISIVIFISSYIVEILQHSTILLLTTWLLYGVFAVLISILVSIKISFHFKISSLLGGISYSIYLTHMKLIDIVAYMAGEPKFIYSLLLIFAFSVILFRINRLIKI